MNMNKASDLKSNAANLRRSSVEEPPAKSSKDIQDKDLMLDKDMEKDTWNFKSITDDDPMDFGFETQPKNKKNAFKLDMGFDLDGDFGSFKMDMPDFDFSSPSKKTTKTKEKSDDKSSGNVKQKKDLFSFSYDFNALDDFDLGSSSPKKGSKAMDCQGTSAGGKFDKSDALDFDLDSSPPKKGNETKTKTVDCKEIPAGRNFDKSDALDFDLGSSPPKKGSKAKTKTMDCEGTSAGRKLYKSDALDFDLDSSPLKKGRETKTKTVDCKEIPAGRKFEKSDALDFDLDLPATGQAASKAKKDVKTNASAEIENQIPNTTDTMVVDNSTYSKQATSESIENAEAVESPQSSRLNSSETHMMCLEPQSVNTSPLKKSSPMVEEIDEPCPANETRAPSPLHASETAHTAVNRETSPDIHEICRSGTKDSPRHPDQNAHMEMASITESSYEKKESNISSRLCLDKTEYQQEEMSTDTEAEIPAQTRTVCDPDAGNLSSGTRPSLTAKVQDPIAKLPLAPSHSVMDIDTQAEIVDQARKTLRDPDAGHSQTTLSGKISPPSSSRQTFQVQDSNATLPLAPSHSVPSLNDLKAPQNKESGLIRSRFFKKAEQTESHVLEPSPARTESRPDTGERKGLTLKSTADRSSGGKDALPGSKARRSPLELVNTDSEKNIENANTISSHEKKIIHKDHSNAKTVEHVTGLLDRSKMQAKNTTRERSMLQINISSKLDASSLTQKLSKHLSSGAESLQKPKIVPLERPKLGNIVSDMRAAKTQRTIGVYKDQPSSAVQPEVSSSISKEKTTETPVKKSSEIHHLAPKDKTPILLCPSSLKRKALDEDADKSVTQQLKRFSMSPRENRNVEELTHRVAQEKFSIQESRIDNKNTTKELVKNSPRIKSHHQSINLANLEIPITENNDNVEKAEAYTKELENICNILKKKHEEVKELLVRAVVNNNKLLMLNHPLHENKIRMVQEFAAKLTLTEQHMMQT